MTITDCADDARSIRTAAMDDEPWQLRLRALGLSQKAWARLSGQTENTVSRQLREEWKLPRLVRLAILAWERLTPEQRADIERELEQTERDRKL